MKFVFEALENPKGISKENWTNWKWQIQNSLKSVKDFESFFQMKPNEKQILKKASSLFSLKTTPYYALLCQKYSALKKMTLPSSKELEGFFHADPLEEKKHSPAPRIIHRYPDRVLFLATDFCGIYCRYCTRKHFTAQGNHVIPNQDYRQALRYIQTNKGIREVILSGGDPLTLSDSRLKKILNDIRSIPHIEIIRIGTRMPAVCPFRITPELLDILVQNQPVFIMTHFNHPKELTQESKNSLSALCGKGISVYNQMVLLNGVNNHPAVVQALSRRLLYIRVHPYYMFQCDPSQGTDHFRTTISHSKWIQKQLWGVLSGLAVPRLSMDLPGGGGKVEFTPDHFIKKINNTSIHQGFDGIQAGCPDPASEMTCPKKEDIQEYLEEWAVICSQTYGRSRIKEKYAVS